MIGIRSTGIFILFLALCRGASGQLSPGDLAQPHAHLEGMSNCTKCHLLGEKVSNEKCLECHSELKSRISQGKGYHSSAEVKGKECIKCHSDHHGRNFEMIRFDVGSFNHTLTGYALEGAHAKKECASCHQKKFIESAEIKKKESTYLGLSTACLSCHDDYHQNTLPADCFSCHDFASFKPAPKFSHDKSDYPLKGKHQEVDCSKCHKMIIRNGKEFREFSGVAHENCTNCHTDVHQDRFGQNCIQCHSEQSFHVIRELTTFDHSKTGYILEGKHRQVDCKACHKTGYTDPVRHDRCKDCHADYHQGQFSKPQNTPDCSDCHTLNGFQGSLYTMEKHSEGNFPLNGAHQATPCFVCHKKQEKWSFRNIGMRCIDCHQNIHEPYLDKKFYPEATCLSCHGESRWNEIKFDHSTTKFELQGAHQRLTCRACHFIKGDDGVVKQQFSGLGGGCTNCHKDVHQGQFNHDGITDCTLCHAFEKWSTDKFDHDNARFRLDGAHKNVACKECHKPVQLAEATYILYKTNKLRCEDCHK
jgi:hypothetical protein